MIRTLHSDVSAGFALCCFSTRFVTMHHGAYLRQGVAVEWFMTEGTLLSDDRVHRREEVPSVSAQRLQGFLTAP
jgi:hypothetical protein